MHGHCDSDMHGHCDSGVHGHCDSDMHGHCDSDMHGHCDSDMHGHCDSGVHGHCDSDMHGHCDSDMHGHCDSDMHGHCDSDMHEQEAISNHAVVSELLACAKCPMHSHSITYVSAVRVWDITCILTCVMTSVCDGSTYCTNLSFLYVLLSCDRVQSENVDQEYRH